MKQQEQNTASTKAFDKWLKTEFTGDPNILYEIPPIDIFLAGRASASELDRERASKMSKEKHYDIRDRDYLAGLIRKYKDSIGAYELAGKILKYFAPALEQKIGKDEG